MNGFRKYLTVFCTVIMIGASSSAFANFLVVTSDQVNVNTEGLFVSLNGITVPVESLNLANDGYFVAIPSPRADICPSCGNDAYTPGRTCSSCGFPIWDGKKQIK